MNKHDSKTADELILDRVPTEKGRFKSIYEFTTCKCTEWYFKEIRSLADIAELVELRKKNAELESHNLGLTKTLVEFEQERAIRDLEQQAQGVDNYANLTIFPSMGDGFSGVYCSGFEAALHEASCVAKSLKEQAKKLKDGAK